MPADRPLHLYEACAGSAAVSLAAFGATPPATYRGGKRRYAKAILHALGIEPLADLRTGIRVTLTEPGLWGRAWSLLACGLRDATVKVLSGMRLDGRPLFDQIVDTPPPEEPAEWLASFLALQSAAVLGKEVSIGPDGRWRTAGYATLSTSAVQKGFRERLLPAQLAKRVAGIPLAFLNSLGARCARASVELDGAAPTHVLIDPPYQGTSGYQAKLARSEVIDLARSWAASGAIVGVCEHEPIEELVAEGWIPMEIGAQPVAFGPRTACVRKSEWLTVKRPRAPGGSTWAVRVVSDSSGGV